VRLVETVGDLRRVRRELGGTWGLVPTMGALHRGHLSLVERARAENDRVAASLFVNPTQFGPREDLARYPRDLERDRALLEGAGCDVLFAPPVEEIYPPGFSTYVDPGKVALPLEGESRPGHFRGVATVVLKLLGIVEPDRAYFGEKDAQQLAVIEALVRDLNVPVAIVGCPIVREPDGLALSSRNVYLGPEERRAATVLVRALMAARGLFVKGERDASALRRAMDGVLDKEPLAETDYAAVVDPLTFDELETIEGSARLLLAVRIGATRLIDNLRLP
jgi:pantoate--beta-alanine ligase